MSNVNLKIKELPRTNDVQKAAYADLLERSKAVGLTESATEQDVINAEKK